MARRPRLPRIDDYIQPQPPAPPQRMRIAGVTMERPAVLSEKERAEKDAAFERKLAAIEAEENAAVATVPVSTASAIPEGATSPLEASPVRSVPLSQLVVSPWNARPSDLDVEALQKLIVAISCAGGVQSPLHVYPDEGSDRYAIIDGQRRFHAATALNLAALPCIVHDRMDALRLYAMSFGLSETGEKPSALDNALMWSRLQEEGIVSGPRQIAELVGMSEGYVSRILLFHEFAEEIQDRLRASANPRLHSANTFTLLNNVKKMLGEDAVGDALDLLENTDTPISAVLGKLKASKRTRQVKAGESRPLLCRGKKVGAIRHHASTFVLAIPESEDNPDLARKLFSALESVVQNLLESNSASIPD